ncbi:hypothetical protein SERLADRAFT_432479 [Serpula lacrymans var. lacrymans S7.9]|nr:uncharacterized protein SERLADRAFT_432479 [Serpula lacrymans var. lacrymans S7.9]EGO30839.1 hypothetical protein SERLADRAFT_432479 [Serpula lacrymans var. lacrymans S7.9]
MPIAEKRKPRDKPCPYNRQLRAAKNKDAPATSAKPPVQRSRQNLTLGDWLTVFTYIDTHPNTPQADIVAHFCTLKSGALIFTQSALSQKLKDHIALEARINDNPSALSAKHPRIVTRPDVEKALVLWIQSMEARGEHFIGPMLKEKQKHFEDNCQVPIEERLIGDGWDASFCRTYNIQEYRRHGEAGSVDLDAVSAERERCQKILLQFAPRDWWNFNVTALFPFAPPDRGLATKQMSGKKKEKFRISVGLACNADGSEKFEPIYIGKSRRPCCFKKQSPKQLGIYYRNNKKAWITTALFEEWMKHFNLKMRNKNRQVCLFVDGFSAHKLSYQPTNVRMEVFKANMTLFVQPCDAGIICCFKAGYRKTYCAKALDLDEAGKRDIYSINLLEGILMAKAAWEAVTLTTIHHCWDHSQIQPYVKI